MLNVKSFESLPVTEQMQYIHSEGHYLHYRIKGWCKINIYWLGSFYAEVWFLYNLKDVGLIRTYTKATCLDPYLADLHVPQLFE
ncbi:hypothetical protein AHMF7605_08485 [Adhaeribacter arboris]|uniref:Uncharacterized protein n=2 Tax=Adhaeribacter arboris TaxID=2072846 RepID=A0A2T2YDH2_9BACT|nr:hypothetical protein AHMF7605_08485 [Adhaeribacter arboris]